MSTKSRSNNSKNGAQRRNTNRPATSRAESAARKPVNQQKKRSKKKAPPMLKQNKLVLILSVLILGLCLLLPDVLAVLSPALGNTLRIVSIIGIVAALVANYYNVTITEGIGKILPRRDDDEEWEDEDEFEDEDEWDDEDEFEDEFEDEEEEEAPPAPQPRRRRPAQQSAVPAPVALKKCECGAELPEKAKFCLECGKAVPQKHVCACGAELPAKAKFCLECGKAVTAAPAPAARPAKPQAPKAEGGKK